MTVEEELNAWNFWEDSRYAFAPSVAAAVSLAGEELVVDIHHALIYSRQRLQSESEVH